MELMIVRHGETQAKTGITTTHDGPLTDNGLRQVILSAAWIDQNFLSAGYKGITSPYFGCVQTASLVSNITGVPFFVSPFLRDFSFEEREGSISIENRSLLFSNLSWPAKEWDENHVDYSEESITELVDRCIQFLYVIGENGYDKVMMVTHVTPAIVLAELALGKSREEMITICNTAATAIRNPSKLPQLLQQKNILLHGIAHCGMSLISNKEAHWFNKIVYAG